MISAAAEFPAFLATISMLPTSSIVGYLAHPEFVHEQWPVSTQDVEERRMELALETLAAELDRRIPIPK